MGVSGPLSRQYSDLDAQVKGISAGGGGGTLIGGQTDDQDFEMHSKQISRGHRLSLHEANPHFKQSLIHSIIKNTGDLHNNQLSII